MPDIEIARVGDLHCLCCGAEATLADVADDGLVTAYCGHACYSASALGQLPVGYRFAADRHLDAPIPELGGLRSLPGAFRIAASGPDGVRVVGPDGTEAVVDPAMVLRGVYPSVGHGMVWGGAWSRRARRVRDRWVTWIGGDEWAVGQGPLRCGDPVGNDRPAGGCGRPATAVVGLYEGRRQEDAVLCSACLAVPPFGRIEGFHAHWDETSGGRWVKGDPPGWRWNT